MRPSVRPRAEIGEVPSELADAMLQSDTEPFAMGLDLIQQIPEDLWMVDVAVPVLVVPLRWEPDGFGAIVVAAQVPDRGFEDRDMRLGRGIADITSLALGNARRLSELERFHELVESLHAVFWEADAATTFTFLGGRVDDLLGPSAPTWTTDGRRWGDHIAAADRDAALDAVDEATEAGTDRSVEYRVVTPDGTTVWIRDVVHVVRGAQRRPTAPRPDGGRHGTQASRTGAAQERAQVLGGVPSGTRGAQRLRALDEMKNTFLEAVSHDLRTPLTSILGSALTLEQTRFELPREESLDLVRRVATNARKLERLLTDLLDLDRLQRGIVSPQRRPTQISALDRAGRSTSSRIRPATRSRSMWTTSPCRSTQRRSSASWRTCSPTRSATRQKARGSGSLRRPRTAA